MQCNSNGCTTGLRHSTHGTPRRHYALSSNTVSSMNDESRYVTPAKKDTGTGVLSHRAATERRRHKTNSAARTSSWLSRVTDTSLRAPPQVNPIRASSSFARTCPTPHCRTQHHQTRHPPCRQCHTHTCQSLAHGATEPAGNVPPHHQHHACHCLQQFHL